MAEALAEPQPPLQPAHRRQVTVFSVLMHAGLLIICASAVYTLQPTLTLRQWAACLILALAMIICAIATRGRCSFRDGGKLITALGAMVVLWLARDPQLAELPGLGEHLPDWLVAAAPGVATVAVLIAVICGFLFVRTLTSYVGHGHTPPFLRALNWSALIVLVLGIGIFLILKRFYEMDVAALTMLLANVIQYYLLLSVMLSASGRTTVGAAPQVYLAVAILLAFARNVAGGMVFGGEGP